jgi:hypothetical protein
MLPFSRHSFFLFFSPFDINAQAFYKETQSFESRDEEKDQEIYT